MCMKRDALPHSTPPAQGDRIFYLEMLNGYWAAGGFEMLRSRLKDTAINAQRGRL